MRSGVALRNELVHLDPDASGRRAFIVNCSPILGGGEAPVGLLISFDDVTELEAKEVALKLSMEEAKAANRSKSEFLANMSHEIRTPMNAILGFTDVLRRRTTGTQGGDDSRYLQIIHSSGKHLLELINDVLDLSKVESGRLEVERIACAPHEMLRATLQTLDVKAQEKGIALTLEVEGEVPSEIASDPARLRQIVTNLVGNAIRFTETGGVRVVERLVRSGPEPVLVIDVIDTGVGIPEDKLDSIFEAFVQADASVTRRFGGTGLGLAISRKLARLLGGDVSVTSRPGDGSTFSITIATGPLEGVNMLDAKAALARAQEIDRDHSRWEFSRGHVLVVDDRPENRELLRVVLEEVGLRVDEAENGAVAVEMVLEGEFDAVLMDVQMPVMDGLTAARKMREHGIDLPVYALTAHAMKGAAEECREAGYSGHIPKPIDADLLLRTLARDMDGRRILDEPSVEAVPMTGAKLPAIQALEEDAAPLVSRLSGNPRMHRVLRRFPARLAEQLEAMEKAWAARDFAEVANVAHALKGSGGTLGFDAFHAPSGRLEQEARRRQPEQIEALIEELRTLERRVVVPKETT